MNRVLSSLAASLLLIGIWGCATIQESATKTPDHRPCMSNLNVAGVFLAGQKYSTHQQFGHADEGVVFDKLVSAIASEGYQVNRASRELGMVSAARRIDGGGKTIPLDVILIQNNEGLLRVELTLSLPAGHASGSMEIENLFCKILESVPVEKQSMETNRPAQSGGDEGKAATAPAPDGTLAPEWKAGETLMLTGRTAVRSQPSHRSRIVKSLKKGTKAEYLGRSGDWVNIRVSAGPAGWVLSRSVALSKPPDAAAPQEKSDGFAAFFAKFRAAVRSQNKTALERLMSSQFDWAVEGYISREVAMQYIDQIVGWKKFWRSAKKAVSTKPQKCEISSTANYHSGYCVRVKSPSAMELVFERGSDGHWYWTAFPGDY